MIEMSWYVGIALPVLVRGDFVTEMSALNALKKMEARSTVRVPRFVLTPCCIRLHKKRLFKSCSCFGIQLHPDDKPLSLEFPAISK